MAHPLRLLRYVSAPLALATLLRDHGSSRQLIGWMSEAETVRRDIDHKLRQAKFRAGLQPGGAPARDSGPILYSVVRCVRPKMMVETGVASGVSSYNILAAMQKNGEGVLWSVDLPLQSQRRVEGNPDNLGLPVGETPGWLVPQGLRDAWHLELGKSSQLLPRLLDRLGAIDAFFHDSEHSYYNMRFEFGAAWPRLSKAGVLISDDVDTNAAFSDFVGGLGLRHARVGGLGLVRKPDREDRTARPPS
jgi:predicted O-methyltransferase YrrM